MTDAVITPITLEPADYPPPTVSMLNLAPADVGGAVHLGDPFLDAETVAALHGAVEGGMLALDPSWQGALAAADASELELRFLERLRATKLSPSAPALHHRRLALFEAVREIGSKGSIPGFGFTVHNLTRAIGDVETWQEGKRQELRGLGLADEQVVLMLVMLSPDQLASLLQVSTMTLSNWRTAKRGPAWAQISPRTIRYPVASVLDWLREGQVSAR